MKANSNVPDSILAKIAKLKKSQESFEKIGSINEAETFAAKIQNLLDEYNLSIGEISLEERMEEFTKEHMNHMIPSVGGTTAYDIMRVIAKYNYCKVLLRTTETGKVIKMTIYGSKENVDICKYIYNNIKPVFMKAGKAKFEEMKSRGIYKKGLDTFMRAFLVGCGNGLNEKLESEKQNSISKNAKLGDLILVNNSALMQWMGFKPEEIKKGKGSKVNSYVYEQGKQTGRNVSINKAVSSDAKPVVRNLLK